MHTHCLALDPAPCPLQGQFPFPAHSGCPDWSSQLQCPLFQIPLSGGLQAVLKAERVQSRVSDEHNEGGGSLCKLTAAPALARLVEDDRRVQDVLLRLGREVCAALQVQLERALVVRADVAKLAVVREALAAAAGSGGFLTAALVRLQRARELRAEAAFIAAVPA